jgi:hypothetical protein
MTITLNGTTGITTPAETATTSVTTPLLTSPAATALTIQSAGTTAMTVGTNRNIGVGGAVTSDTTYKWLTITGPTTSGGGIVQLNNSNSSVGINMFCTNLAGYVGTSTAHPLLFRTNNSEAARIDISGNVGIGTNSPVARLQVSSAGSTELTVRSTETASWKSRISLGNTTAGSKWEMGADPDANGINSLYFYDAAVAATRMRIDQNGNVLMGATSVNPAVGMSFIPNASGIAYAWFGHASGVAAGNWYMAFGYDGTLIGNIVQVGTTSVAYNTSSDYRLKENVTPMTTGLTTVNALKPVTYDWKSDKSSGEGFIAHELQAFIPHAVTGEKDAVNEDGSIKPQGVDYSKIVVHLVAAMQEQQAQIEDLKARLAAVEAK